MPPKPAPRDCSRCPGEAHPEHNHLTYRQLVRTDDPRICWACSAQGRACPGYRPYAADVLLPEQIGNAREID